MTNEDKKKVIPKKTASKLGHDPLAWIDEVNASPASGAEVTSAAIPEGSRYGLDAPPIAKPEVKVTGMSAKTATLSLPVYFGIAQSADICSEMRNIINSGCKTIQIAGGDVESFDTAAVQLMMAFNKQAGSSGIEISWSGCSEKIVEIKKMIDVRL